MGDKCEPWGIPVLICTGFDERAFVGFNNGTAILCKACCPRYDLGIKSSFPVYKYITSHDHIRPIMASSLYIDILIQEFLVRSSCNASINE